MKTIYKYFPVKVKENISTLMWDEITEIRLRINKPIIINLRSSEIILEQIVADKMMIEEIFNSITNYSAYAYENSIKNGFLTLPGGHRVGFGGEVVVKEDKIVNVNNITYLNFRISHFIKNCGVDLIKYILDGQGIKDTIIISPPGLGKTTLLRDLVRLLSKRLAGKSISVIDERNEISGCYKGIPSIDLGFRTDVISGCKKEDGILMALRSMSPNIIAVDEIGGRKDIDALNIAKNSGVNILATIHGKNKDDAICKIGQAALFEKFVIIKEKGVYECL